jgi:hypothetical protein
MEHQPSPRGWAESSPQYMSRVRASPGWLGRVRPNLLLLFFLEKEKGKIQKKYLFGILQVSRVFFVILINIKQYFFLSLKIQYPIFKYLVFIETFKNTKKL